ncbi:MAG: asparagine synthase (glutamine-hydrolyzing) [archaeon]
MCGICGFIGEDRETLRRMTDILQHRGPDDSGYFSDGRCSLGHRRLSIIDLKSGKQPIHNEDASVYVVFNGEIYNFKAARKELMAAGHRFSTDTDTEVIVHAYEEYGYKCLEKFNGMFAFAIWDTRYQRLFLARDRLGQKPLFYTNAEGFVFASEIKPLLLHPSVKREINKSAIDKFLTFLYVPCPETILKSVMELPPAHYLVYEKGSITIRRYWDINPAVSIVNEAASARKVRQLISEAVQLRLMSDVPLGAFLSGGLDSTITVGLMSRMMENPVKTFSIGFEEQDYNELKFARIASEAFGTEHREFIVKQDAVKVLPKLVWHFDQPFADASAIPTYYVSELTKKHVTVVLTGDGADETFGGYRRYWSSYLSRKYARVPNTFKRVIRHIVPRIPATSLKYDPSRYINKFIGAQEKKPEERYLDYMTTFTRADKKLLYQDLRISKMPRFAAKFGDELSSMQYADIATYLPGDILVKVDRMSMAHSLETRSPFLDYRVAELAMRIAPGLRVKRLNSKYILKRAVYDLVPEEILNRKKAGFVVPVSKWFRGELFDLCSDVLLSREALKRGYFSRQGVEKIINRHRKGDYGNHLWAMLNLETWHRMFEGGKFYKAGMNLGD